MRTLLLALALMLACAGTAQADVVNSNITTPSDPSFPVFTGSNTMHVAGTATTSGATNNSVDIVCTFGSGGGSVTAQTGVPVDTGTHTFSADVQLLSLQWITCVLRAVPSGTDPSALDLTPFSGPRLGIARLAQAPPGDRWTDFELALGPFGGNSDFNNVSNCGVAATYALDPVTLDFSGEAWGCSDSLWDQPSYPAGRPSVRVDGKDSYFASGFHDAGTATYPDNPDPVLTVDPTNGLGSASSQNNLGGCSPGGAFPPDNTNCANGVSNGVRDDHTATLTRSGELVVTGDTFVSTDGHPHTLDLWFAQSSGTTGPTWRFPGQTSFAAHAGGQELSGLPGGPGATIQNGINCYGVFAWNAPPDVVHFLDGDRFYTHYAVSVPAGGSATISFAYGSTFTEDEANALVPAALAAVSPPASSPPAGGGGPAPSGGAKLLAKLGRVRIGRDGTVTVLVNVPDAGSVSGLETAVVPRSAAKKKRTKKLIVSRARKGASKAGQVKLVLRLNRKGKRIFRAKHRLRVTLSVTYKPSTGSGNKLTRHLTLKLKKARRHKH
jgi:hypothetical protein